jgi:hypothetical protein
MSRSRSRSRFHLFRYLDEQCYRFNNRKTRYGERFDLTVRRIGGKRLTFDQLTGKVESDRLLQSCPL